MKYLSSRLTQLLLQPGGAQNDEGYRPVLKRKPILEELERFAESAFRPRLPARRHPRRPSVAELAHSAGWRWLSAVWCRAAWMACCGPERDLVRVWLVHWCRRSRLARG